MTTEIAPHVLDILEQAIDDKIAKRSKNRSTTTTAVVSRVDSDGTVWATLPGASIETPVSYTGSYLSPGDLIGLTVGDGVAISWSNFTDKSVTMQYLQDIVNQMSAEYKKNLVENSDALQTIINNVRGVADSALQGSTDALSLASGTNAHFFTDENGAHVATKAEEYGKENSGYSATIGATDSTTGIIFQHNSDILTSLTPTALNFYQKGKIISAYTNKGSLIGHHGYLDAVFGGGSLTFYDGEIPIEDYINYDIPPVKLAEHIRTAFTSSETMIGNPLNMHTSIKPNAITMEDLYSTFFNLHRSYTTTDYTEIFVISSGSDNEFFLTYPISELIEADISTITSWNGSIWNPDGTIEATVQIFPENTELYSIANDKMSISFQSELIEAIYDSSAIANTVAVHYKTKQYPNTRLDVGFYGDNAILSVNNLIRAVGKKEAHYQIEVGTEDEANHCLRNVLSGYATLNDYGLNLVIGGGGNTVVGSGESAYTYYDYGNAADNSEHMYVVSDNSIFLLTNLNRLSDDGTFPNKRTVQIDTYGDIIPPYETAISYYPTASQNSRGIVWKDNTNSYVVGAIHARAEAAKGTGLEIFGCHIPTGQTSPRYNALQLYVKEDGTRTVTVSEQVPWRNAIGANSGIWPVSIGGSGQSNSTSTTTISQIITAGANVTINAASYAQWGKVASIEIYFKYNAAISVPANGNITNITVGTIVSGKRPKIRSHFVGDGDNSGQAFGNIATTGAVGIGGFDARNAAYTIASGGQFRITATYILA